MTAEPTARSRRTRSRDERASAATSNASRCIRKLGALGWGQTLVLDALRWLGRHDASRALVNTQWENEGALALYESCGFRHLPVGLCVLDRAL